MRRSPLWTPAVLLALSACAAAVASGPYAPPPATPAAVSPPLDSSAGREQTADQQVQHVLNRLAFGPRPGDVAAVRTMGVDGWIAQQLAPAGIADTAAQRVVASYRMLDRPTAELVALYEEGRRVRRLRQRDGAGESDSSGMRERRAEAFRDDPALRELRAQLQRTLGDVQSAKLARAVVSERQLEEVMTDFWENHFTVYAGKGVTRLFIPSLDRDVIRPRVLGKFRDLLGAVAKSPAMLFYLDQWQSAADSTHPTLVDDDVSRRRRAVRDRLGLTGAGRLAGERPAPAPRRQLVAGARERGPAASQPLGSRRRGLNENYARELLELHTLGVDGGYTQRDVVEVARALTGWTMAPRQHAEFVFIPAIHDAGEKQVLGHTLPAGRGIEDGEEVLDLVARHPSTARFIARKLAVRFVSDEPPSTLVDRAAETFRQTDGDIRETVRTIVTSPEFFSRAAYRSKVKSPFELAASALRAVAARADTSMRSAQLVAYLGQPIFGHQAPNGWPETGEAWMNSGAILNRINFGLAIAAGRVPGASVSDWAEEVRLRDAPRETQVDAVISAFLGGQASPETRQILLTGENPLARHLTGTIDTGSDGEEMTMTAASGMDRSPVRGGAPRRGAPRTVLRPVQLGGLPQVVGLALGAPEFQRR